MADPVITNIDMGGVILDNPEYRDELLTFAGAATILAGTILARDSVSLKMVPYVKGGVTNENGIPKEVIVYEVVATGAGDIPIRGAIAGSYRLPKLVIDADGDASNIDSAVVDQLRNYGLVPIDVQELFIPDNQ